MDVSELDEATFQNAFIACSKSASPQIMMVSPWHYQMIRAGWDEKHIRYVTMVRKICCDIERDWERQYGPQYQTSIDDSYAEKLRAFRREAEYVADLERSES
jgi:hypothetical protein